MGILSAVWSMVSLVGSQVGSGGLTVKNEVQVTGLPRNSNRLSSSGQQVAIGGIGLIGCIDLPGSSGCCWLVQVLEMATTLYSN